MKKAILLIVMVVLVLAGCEKQTIVKEEVKIVEKEVKMSGWKKCSEFLFLSEKDGDKKRCSIDDFNGDGKNDIVIYDPANAGFRIMSSK